MFLKSLLLRNFRLYDEAYFEFDSGINILCGPNAAGKTTLLEAIHFLVSGRSFRNWQLLDLIKQGESAFFLEAAFVKNGIEQSIKIYYGGARKKIFYNSTECPSLTALLGTLQGVALVPTDVEIIKGAPAARRYYLDMQIAQVDPLYVHHLTRYHKAMTQRNHLLKIQSLSSIECWEQEMAKSASYITKQRATAVEELKEDCKNYYSFLGKESEPLVLSYKTSCPAHDELEMRRQHYLQQYGKHRLREVQLKTTLTGPHKDDLIIDISSKEARFFASEGQQRSGVTAMRMAEWTRLKALGGESPLMLIDDFGMSLDDSRRSRLIEHIQTLGQVFVTSTHALPISGKMLNLPHFQ